MWTGAASIRTTRKNHRSSPNTLKAERELGIQSSAYYYAGRCFPDFGDAIIAFAPTTESHTTGAATPFDTGGLNAGKIKTDPALCSVAERSRYVADEQCDLTLWRANFSAWLASYFGEPGQYWSARPVRIDLRRTYELNTDARAWTWEIRFHEDQPVIVAISWTAPPEVLITIRSRIARRASLSQSNPSSALAAFCTNALDCGQEDMFAEFEQWIREHIGL